MNNLMQKKWMLLVAFLRAAYEVQVERKMIFSLLLLVTTFSFNSLAQQTNILSDVSSGAIKQDLKSIVQLLNSDGTINENAKATGSFDVSNYEMTYGENGEPVFLQKANKAITTGEGVWSDQFPGPSGTNSSVYAVVKDASNNIYIGGNFTTAGGIANTKYIAKWNGSAWSALGTGMNNSVTSIAIDGSGNVYAGGSFTIAGGIAANYIAKWNGSTWSTLGIGMNNSVNAIAIDGLGNIYAGGRFTTAGGDAANYIAKWNGTWSALGLGLSDAVNTIAINKNGNDVYVGGYFSQAGGKPASRIAKWNGGVWSALGAGMFQMYICFVSTIAIDGSGNVYAGGTFEAAGGLTAKNIAKWNGSAWSALGSGVNTDVSSIAIDGSGNLYVGGWFTIAGGVAANKIAKWDGSAWSALGSGMNYIGEVGTGGTVHAIALYGSNLYTGSDFRTAGEVGANYVAKWNGSTWSTLGTGINNQITSMAVDHSGNVYIAGSFINAGGITANSIAKWDGSAWTALGTGLTGSTSNRSVETIAIDGSGNVYAGGNFTTAGGIAVRRIAKWNGSAWSALGTGIGNFYGYVYAIAIDGNSNVYVGGDFYEAGGVSVNRIAKWNGSTWTALGSGAGGSVKAIAVDGNSNVYAGGEFTTAGGINASKIAKWDGTNWSALGTGMTGIDRVAKVLTIGIDVNDNVYAGGYFTSAGGVVTNSFAKWNGLSWSALGTGVNNDVSAIAFDGNGNVYAGGLFTTAGGVAVNRIAKWNGSAWSALGTGVDNNVYAIKTYNNIVYCGGDFLYADGVNSAYFGKYAIVAPEIDVKQASATIADGTGTYDFDSKNLATSTDIVFTIENTGTSASSLSGFSISGLNADQFIVQGSIPATVPANGTATFTIRFRPTSAGVKTAIVSFINEDKDENPYDFNITGTGVDIGTSIDLNNLLSLQVSPNPVRNQFRINGLTSKAAITILDMTGKVCQKAVISSASVISVDELAKGMYIVHVSSENKTAKLKLIKD